MLAFVHAPSPLLGQCELTYLPRVAIDCDRAMEQHRGYCDALRRLGVTVQVLQYDSRLPDAVFIEDTALVLGSVAILMSMGTASRRAECEAVASALRATCAVRRIELPAMIEAGDVLAVGRKLLVGHSTRTCVAGIRALADIAEPLGYTVHPVRVSGCLHLKTACGAIDDRRLVVNRDWIDTAALSQFDFELVPVPIGEPWSANLVRIGHSRILAAEHVRAADMIRSFGYDVIPVDISEFAKAEGGVTCLSLLVPGDAAAPPPNSPTR